MEFFVKAQENSSGEICAVFICEAESQRESVCCLLTDCCEYGENHSLILMSSSQMFKTSFEHKLFILLSSYMVVNALRETMHIFTEYKNNEM